MMRKFRKQFNRITLTKHEAEDMRKNLLAHMRANPASVRNEKESRLIIRKPALLFPLFLNKKFMLVSIVLALMVMVSGGTAVAAETTIPGDLLYPVKVHINENVRAAFATSDEAKAEWEAERADRRMEEAAALEVQGELKADVVTHLETMLDAHIERAEAHIAKLTEQGQLEAAAAAQTRLEASISARQKILQRLRERNNHIEKGKENNANTTTPDNMNGSDGSDKKDSDLPSVRPVERLLNALEHRLEVQEGVRARIEERLENASEEQLKNAATQAQHTTQVKLDATAKLISKFEATHGDQTRARTELKAAAELKARADAKLAAQAYGEALELYHKAQATLVRARVHVEARVDIGVDLGDESDEDEVKEGEEKNKNEKEQNENRGRNENDNDKKDRAERRRELKADADADVDVKIEVKDEVEAESELDIDLKLN